MKCSASLLLLGVLAGHATAQAPAWRIDPNHSAARFAVRHLLVSTVRGELGRVTGTIDYDGRTVESIAVDVTIDMTAINTHTADRDADLRSPNFFDVARYPTATFKSKRVESAGAGKFKLIGDLTMHGITKEVTLDVEGPSPPLVARGQQRVGATATGRINRHDWGLNYSGLMEAAPVVGDEVTITIDVEATRAGG